MEPVQDQVQVQPNPTTVEQVPVPVQEIAPVSEIPPAPPLPKPKSKFSKKFISIVIGIILILGAVGVIIMFIVKGGVGVGSILPIASITPAPTATATAAPTSPYVNDPEVLKIEEDLGALDAKLNSTDLREDTLRVPVLEWEVEFD